MQILGFCPDLLNQNCGARAQKSDFEQAFQMIPMFLKFLNLCCRSLSLDTWFLTVDESSRLLIWIGSNCKKVVVENERKGRGCNRVKP